jgi:hypothetical protein
MPEGYNRDSHTRAGKTVRVITNHILGDDFETIQGSTSDGVRIFLSCFFHGAWPDAIVEATCKRGYGLPDGKERCIARTDEERIKIVLELIAKGALRGPEDQFDAGLVLQHTPMEFWGERLVSKSADNYLIAHYPFISAYDGGYKDALYLIAASIDRYLSMTEGYQKYGTNREFNQVTGRKELVPIDRKTTDSERAKYGVPPLAELLKRYPEQIPQKKAP